MKSISRLFCCNLLPGPLLSVMLLSSAAGQTTTTPPGTDDMSRKAEVVVVGTVNRVASEWNASHTRIVTRVTLAVDQYVKGSSTGGTMTLVVPGGEVGGVGEWYSHSPQFKENEDVLVFAEKDAQGMLRVTAGNRGKISLRKDGETGRRVLSNGLPLERLMNQIRDASKIESH